jgi:hypothetical protein
MTQRSRTRISPLAQVRPPDEGPRTTPQTDPTNPFHQERVGEWVAAEHHPERSEGVHSPPLEPTSPSGPTFGHTDEAAGGADSSPSETQPSGQKKPPSQPGRPA